MARERCLTFSPAPARAEPGERKASRKSGARELHGGRARSLQTARRPDHNMQLSLRKFTVP